ncbi:MAG: hypothetical protein JW904_07350 [Spirochaetales bacterium]|nr:hypothetical protein [Spirochaetales bacterium]
MKNLLKTIAITGILFAAFSAFGCVTVIKHDYPDKHDKSRSIKKDRDNHRDYDDKKDLWDRR